jgi:hypothetical protein
MPQNGHVLVVEIDPADVVSIPTDCNYQKLRTCKYKVVQEYQLPLDENKIHDSRFNTEHDEYINNKWDNKPMMMDTILVSDVINVLDKWGEDDAVHDIKKKYIPNSHVTVDSLKEIISEELAEEILSEFEEIENTDDDEDDEDDDESWDSDDDDDDEYEVETVDLSSHINILETLKNLDEANYVKLKNALEKEYKNFESVQLGEVLKYIESIYDDSDYMFDLLLQYKVEA